MSAKIHRYGHAAPVDIVLDRSLMLVTNHLNQRMKAEVMIKTYTGSCHCGAVRYEADIDLSAGTSKCNCTYCVKVRAWTTFTKPQHFRLAEGSVEGRAYRLHPEAAVKYHCERCGAHTHSRGDADYMGGAFVGISVTTLDDLDVEELLSGPVRLCDGLHNQWWQPPSESRHL